MLAPISTSYNEDCLWPREGWERIHCWWLGIFTATTLSNKLSPWFYGPYRVLESVAYRLDLPPGSKIHPVFHVSILKKQLGSTDKIDSSIPLVSETSGHLQPQPIVVLNSRSNGRKHELLIQWQGLPTNICYLGGWVPTSKQISRLCVSLRARTIPRGRKCHVQ